MLLLMLAVLCHEAFCADFDSTPGVVRVDPGTTAVMKWTLSRPFNPKKYFASLKCFRIATTSKIVDVSYKTETCNVFGDDRIGCILPKTTGSDVGFTIRNVRETDASQYKIEIIHDINSPLIKNTAAYIYIFKSPNVEISGNYETREGNIIKLTCTASSQSIPASLRNTTVMEYDWTINNPEHNHVVNGNQVIIQRSNRKNQGTTFTCVAKEQDSSETHRDTKILNILYSPGTPQIFDLPTRTLLEGVDGLIVTCHLSGENLGNPSPNHYHWRNLDSSYSKDTNNNNKLTLSVVNAKDHDGNWQCEPENVVGKGQPAVFTVRVNSKPSTKEDLPADHGTLNRDALSVKCSFKAKPAASITWMYEDSSSLPDVVTHTESNMIIDRVYTQTTSTLRWHPDVDDDDLRRREAGGKYRCHAVNIVGETDSRNMELYIYYAPYAVYVNTSNLTVAEGDMVTIECMSDCNPACSFIWTRQNDNKWTTNNHLLILPNISKQYDDLYICEAKNRHGSSTTTVKINVNFPPEITAFLISSQDDKFQGRNLTITCQVSSKPKSDVKIINTNTSVDMVSVKDINKALYTFINIHVSDSAIYQCVAINDIKPMSGVSRELTLDVKGGFMFCENPPTEEGVALHANLTVLFCLSANPFTDITNNNWKFESNNSSQVTQSLPDGVSTSVQDTSLMYKKYVMLRITEVLQSHYGTYILNVNNRYNTEELSHILSLVPEGPPTPPSDVKVTHSTAVSIYLKWTAGFDGGPDQTFWLHIYDINSAVWFMISNIPDTTRGQGGLMEYKVTNQQGIVADHKYNIQIGAVNSIANVTGSSVVASAKSQPQFIGDKPDIQYIDGKAEITWPVINLDSVTNIIVEVCKSDDNVCMPSVNITSPEIQPYIIPLPEGDTDNYVFVFTFYDQMDSVYNKRVVIKESSSKGASIAIIIGSAVGVLFCVAVVILILLWRKGIIPKESQRNCHRLVTKPESSRISLSFTNQANDEARSEEVAPYASTSDFGVERQKTSGNSIVQSVANSAEETNIPDETNQIPSQDEVPQYAQVIKKKKQEKTRTEKNKNKGNLLQEPKTDKPLRQRQGEQRTQYVNVLIKDSQDGAYSEVCLPRAIKHDARKTQNAKKKNTNVHKELQFIGPDGTVYADLEVINKPPNDPEKIHGKENCVEYANIDYSQLKKK